MFAQPSLVSDQSKYWGKKNFTYSYLIFYYFANVIVFLQRDKI